MGLAAALALSAVAPPADAQTPKAKPAPPPSTDSDGGPFAFGSLGKSKEPITIVSDKLDYDYKANVVVYHGAVEVTQGDTKMVSDILTITLVSDKQNQKSGPGTKPGTTTNPGGTTSPGATTNPGGAAPDPPNGQAAASTSDTGKVKEMIATGNVRIDQGTRWAVGGRATYEQDQRTLVLTENPVLHDGPNEVVGERVTVYLDENRSVVEGGQKRVKAVFHPNEKSPATPAKPKAAGSAAPAAPAGGTR